MPSPTPFIKRYGLWTDDQRRQAAEVKRRVEKEKLRYVRLAWADPAALDRLLATVL